MSSYDQDVSGIVIYAQRYDNTGIPVGSEFRVNTYTPYDQAYSSVAMDPSGNFVVAWQSNMQDGDQWGIFMKYYRQRDWEIQRVGDFDGDTKADILWRQGSTGGVAAWLMNGATISSDLGVGIVSDLGWKIQGVRDFNGDTKADILWRHSTTGSVAMWLMNGATISSDLGVGIVSDTNWNIEEVGDFNGDTNSDILWRHGTTGSVAMWLMNGATISSDLGVAIVP